MTELIGMVKSAAKAKAPIVAIPREGLTPICLRSKLLRGALKGVTITDVTVLSNSWLQIRGKDGYVRTCSKFAPISRRNALAELSKWTEKEREKVKKRILLGDAGKKLPKAAKAFEYELDGDSAIEIQLLRKPDKTPFTAKGVLIQLRSMPEYEFVLHASGTEGDHYNWRVSERSSGMGATMEDHRSAQGAIEEAEMNFRKASPEKLAEIKAKIAEHRLA
jgi:hypothetical protein